MKILITILTVFMLTSTSFAQLDYFIDFDSPNSQNDHIIIDTVSNPNYIWQIGVPSKTVFNSAYSLTHAIVTDTLNQYPVNDTSSFTLIHIRTGNYLTCESMKLTFWFKFNSDSLTDFGMVEASLDNGTTWINLMTADTIYYLLWIETKPALTGNSNGWQHFAVDLVSLTNQFVYSDTLLYRFTFISDSIQTNKDGWLLDDFHLSEAFGIEEYNNNFVKVYPNPSKGEILIANNSKTKLSSKIRMYKSAIFA